MERMSETNLASQLRTAARGWGSSGGGGDLGMIDCSYADHWDIGLCAVPGYEAHGYGDAGSYS